MDPAKVRKDLAMLEADMADDSTPAAPVGLTASNAIPSNPTPISLSEATIRLAEAQTPAPVVTAPKPVSPPPVLGAHQYQPHVTVPVRPVVVPGANKVVPSAPVHQYQPSVTKPVPAVTPPPAWGGKYQMSVGPQKEK
jgi:hypothetical protein